MNPKYKLYHPKWHRRRFPIFWWLRRASYAKFIARELTSLAVLYAVVLLLAQVWALSQGEAVYGRFQALLVRPGVLLLHAAVLAALLFHTVTWLHLAPRAMALYLGRRRVPDGLILAGHYLAWAAATLFVVWGLVLR